MYSAARLAHALQTNGEQLSFDEWNQMSHLQKRVMVKSAGLAKSLTDGAFQKIEKDRIDRVVGGVIEAAAAEDYYRAEEETNLKRGVTATSRRLRSSRTSRTRSARMRSPPVTPSCR